MNKLTLNDIAGYKSEKEELQKMIEMLNNKEKYYEKGAYIPRGLILYGAPGNGKTLFAKVLANEASFNFFEFDVTEKSVSKRLKELVEKAKKNAPSIIFIDEISRIICDSDYQSDSTRRNLATLLTLIDGFDSSSEQEVFVVGTTNDYGDIPSALIRPGRIDKKIHINYPTTNDRIEILKFYINKTKCSFEFSVEKMAELTGSLSSSGIKTLINSCVISSNNDNFVSADVFTSCLNSIILQDIDKGCSEHDLKIIAYKELGKFIVARSYKEGEYLINLNCDGSSKGEIFSSDNLTDNDDDDDYDDDEEENVSLNEDDSKKAIDNPNSDKIFSKNDFIKDIQISLGAILANKLFNNGPYTCDNELYHDVKKTIDVALQNGFYGVEYIADLSDRYQWYSQEKIILVEKKIISIIKENEKIVESILLQHKNVFDILIPKLMKNKLMDNMEVEPLIKGEFI